MTKVRHRLALLNLLLAQFPFLVSASHTMRARPVTLCNSFCFGLKEYTIASFHSSARAAVKHAINFQCSVAAQAYTIAMY
jgi:hypothetical protein